MLTVDPGLDAPPYEQLKAQIAAARASGEYPAGHRLAPVRQLAAELGLAPNTVARAYRELEAAGVIQTRGRAGSFVTGTDEGRARAADAAARGYLDQALALGLSPREALDAVARAVEQRSASGG